MQIHQMVLGDLETNCYIVWDSMRKALIIDPADDANSILSFLVQQDLEPIAVVLTHAHFDHMLAAQAVCSAVDIPLYIGAGDADAMTDPIRNLSGIFTPSDPLHLDDYLCIRDGDSIMAGDMAFSVMETPGHTPGCICLYCEDVLFSGDTLFRDSIGRLDFPGGDTTAMMDSLRRLMQLSPDTKVFPGHGPSTTIGREVQFNPYLR